MVSLTTILRTSAEEVELRARAATRPRTIREMEPVFTGHLQSYSYSYLRAAVEISSASLELGMLDASLQPGRLVLPVIRRALRSYVKYDHEHSMKTSTQFWKPIRKRMW